MLGSFSTTHGRITTRISQATAETRRETELDPNIVPSLVV